MARDEVVFRVSADEAKAMAAFQRLLDKQQQIDRQTQRGTTRVQQQSSALDKWATNLAKGIAAGAGFATMNQALQTGIGLIEQYGNHLGRITDKMERMSGAGMRAFAAIQEPGAEGARFMQRALLEGARRGITPDETADMLQPLQASVGPEEGLARFVFAAQATQLGVEGMAAMGVERLGIARGLAPGLATSQIIAAATPSGMGEGDFARAAPRTIDASDFATGLAAISALSVSVPEGQLPTSVAAGLRALGPGADDSDFTQAFGLEGMNEQQKIVELWRQSIEDWDRSTGSFAQHLENWTRGFGKFLGSNEERIAVQQIVQQGQLFMESLAAARSATPDMVGQRVAQIRELSPQIDLAMAREQARATIDVRQAFAGPETGRAIDRAAETTRLGVELEAAGMGMMLDEQGQPGRIARLLNFITNPSGSEFAGRQGVGITDEVFEERKPAIDRTIESLDRLSGAMENYIESTGMQRRPNAQEE